MPAKLTSRRKRASKDEHFDPVGRRLIGWRRRASPDGTGTDLFGSRHIASGALFPTLASAKARHPATAVSR